MASDRTWTLARVAVGRSKGQWNVREGTDPSEFGLSGIGEWTDFVSVVEARRLREAEAICDELLAEKADVEADRDEAYKRAQAAWGEAEKRLARAERAEAELREARQRTVAEIVEALRRQDVHPPEDPLNWPADWVQEHFGKDAS